MKLFFMLHHFPEVVICIITSTVAVFLLLQTYAVIYIRLVLICVCIYTENHSICIQNKNSMNDCILYSKLFRHLNDNRSDTTTYSF